MNHTQAVFLTGLALGLFFGILLYHFAGGG